MTIRPSPPLGNSPNLCCTATSVALRSTGEPESQPQLSTLPAPQEGSVFGDHNEKYDEGDVDKSRVDWVHVTRKSTLNPRPEFCRGSSSSCLRVNTGSVI